MTVAAWHNNRSVGTAVGKQFCFLRIYPVSSSTLCIHPCPLNTNLPIFCALDHLFHFCIYPLSSHTVFFNLPHFSSFVHIPHFTINLIFRFSSIYLVCQSTLLFRYLVLQPTLFGHPLHFSTYPIFQSTTEVIFCLYFDFEYHFTLPYSTLLLHLHSFPITFVSTSLPSLLHLYSFLLS